MVYAGVYPFNASEHRELALALEKLCLSDPSVALKVMDLESDQTQLMVKVPASSYFNMPTPHKVCLVWFHFRLTAG